MADDKHPGGRPTLYSPEYIDKAIEYMALGYSITAFAGHIRVSRETVYEWARVHPEFSDALKIARSARVNQLECDLLSAESNPMVTSRIFALKNACPEEWREKIENENTVSITVNTIDYSNAIVDGDNKNDK
jgi:transposase